MAELGESCTASDRRYLEGCGRTAGTREWTAIESMQALRSSPVTDASISGLHFVVLSYAAPVFLYNISSQNIPEISFF